MKTLPLNCPKELQETLRQLIAILPADKIFHKDGTLYIAIGEQAARGIQQYKTILEGSDWERGNYRHGLYTIPDIRQGLEAGNLFYTTVFVQEHLVYDSGQSILPEPLPRRITRIREQSEAEFSLGYRRSVCFQREARHLLAENEPEVAAFMLHQSVELLLRGLVLVMSGKELKSHLLGELLQHASRYVPGLQELFGKDAGKLERAYTCGRYSLHYQVNEADVQLLAGKVEILQEQVYSFFTQTIVAYEKCLPVSGLSFAEYMMKDGNRDRPLMNFCG